MATIIEAKDENYYIWNKEEGVLEFKDPSLCNISTNFDYSDRKDIKRIILPIGLTSIGYSQFSSLYGLENILLPETLKSIEKRGFESCSNLRRIVLPNSIESIGYYAFANTGVESITLHTGKDIFFDMGCFWDCKNLKEIIIIDSNKLETITIPWGPSMAFSIVFENLKEGFNYDNYFKSFSKAKLVDKLEMIIYFKESIMNNQVLNDFFSNLKFTNDFDCFSYAIEKGNQILFNYLLDKEILKYKNINNLIEKTQEQSLIEFTSQLINYKNRIFAKEISKEDDLYLDDSPLTIKKFRETWKVKINGEYLEVEDYLGDETDLYIPSSIEGKKLRFSNEVFKFDNYSTNKRKDRMLRIERIIFEDDVILEVANFENFKNLKEIHLPNSVKYIDFGNDENLVSINLPKSIIKLESGVFRNCTSLIEVIIPSNIKVIPENSFMNCINLESVELPNGIQVIKPGAFNKCSKLEKINFPETIEKIEGDFSDGGAFSGCERIKEVSLTENLTELGYCAFSGCSNLSEVKFPNSLKAIGESAFSYCTNLKGIVIPNTLEVIGNSAFYNCDNLFNVNLPSNLRSIGKSAFSFCSNIENIIIPSNIKCISDNTFSNCKSLKSIEMPNTIEEILNSAFYNCESLVNVVLPMKLKLIGNLVFYGCSSLESIVIPNSALELGFGIFNGCLNLKQVVLPDELTRIEKSMFANCVKLESINISNLINFIGEEAFLGCEKLTNVSIPTNLTKIGNDAFLNSGVDIASKISTQYFDTFTHRNMRFGTEITHNVLMTKDYLEIEVVTSEETYKEQYIWDDVIQVKLSYSYNYYENDILYIQVIPDYTDNRLYYIDYIISLENNKRRDSLQRAYDLIRSKIRINENEVQDFLIKFELIHKTFFLIHTNFIDYYPLRVKYSNKHLIIEFDDSNYEVEWSKIKSVDVYKPEDLHNNAMDLLDKIRSNYYRDNTFRKIMILSFSAGEDDDLGFIMTTPFVDRDSKELKELIKNHLV